MVNGSPQYATANAFRKALEDRLKKAATARGRSLEELRREFLFQRFLALVFAAPHCQWVLKGGASLLIRLAGARFSRDLDLLHMGELTSDEVIEELRTVTAAREGDHLTFVIEDAVSYSRVNPIVEISVTAYIGAKYGAFPIDLARELHLIAVPERVRPTPVVQVPGLPDVPDIVVYPLADQVSDKVCAMYELHGERRSPSSRYRDLVDLVLIVSSCELDAALICKALNAERERRKAPLPERMRSPGPGWQAAYSAYARKTMIDAEFHSLQAALEHVGACINPLLAGSRTHGKWSPGGGWTQ